MPTAEQTYPKEGNDPLFNSEVNDFKGFGDGTDGAFSESSGTTNLTQGVVHQYTSFLLDTSATLSASSTSNKPIIILVQGNVTINGTIDLSGKGSIGNYNAAQNSTSETSWGSVGAGGNGTRGGGIKGQADHNFKLDQRAFIMNGTSGGAGGTPGAGGGGASSSNNGAIGGVGSGGSGTPGVAGVGGCTIIMIIGGTLTFGASSTIDVSGTNGTDAVGGNSGGGGGGGSGDILIFHHGAKTDNGLTTDVTGGTGGALSGTGGSKADGGDGQVKIVVFDTILW